MAPMALAHHSPASFDLKQSITIQGPVTRIEWFNPHVYVHLEETDAAGQKVEWEIEVLPPMALRGFGWFKDTLRVGDVLTATGNPSKNRNKKELFPAVIKLGDRVLFSFQEILKSYSSTEPSAKPTIKTNSMNGTWETVMAIQLLQQFGNPDLTKLTPEGIEAFKRYDEKTSPVTSCIPGPAPLWMVFPDLKKITLADGVVYVEGELGAGRRTIHTGVATHDGAIPSIQGHSIGRWEGKSLVVDTTHFAFHAVGNGAGLGTGLPSSTQKHMVERFTPSEDGKSLTYKFQVTDPVYLGVPVSGEVRWVFSPDKKFEVTGCSIDSARRFLKY
jgi:hypothetical protein